MSFVRPIKQDLQAKFLEQFVPHLNEILEVEDDTLNFRSDMTPEDIQKFVKNTNKEIASYQNRVAENIKINSGKKTSKHLIGKEIRRFKLKRELTSRGISETLADTLAMRNKVNERLRLAEIQNVAVSQLQMSDKEVSQQLLDIQTNKADEIMKQLIKEEAASKKTSAKPKCRKAAPKKAPPKKASLPSKPQPKAAPKKASQKSISWSNSTVQHLQTNNRLQMHEHPRVTKRWEQNDPAVIRTFGPRNEPLSEEDLKAQRARHYLPGLERLVSSNRTKHLYTFETPQESHGIICELNYGDRKEQGVVYIGYGLQDKTLMIHRYFEPYENFSHTSEVFQGRAIRQVETEEEEQWESTTPFAFEKIKADGTINMTFPGEDHSLRIFPTRPQEAARLASGNN